MQMESTVVEVMSSPAITLTPEKTVLEAAALMLKEKVHRIPVVNEQQQVIGKVFQIAYCFFGLGVHQFEQLNFSAVQFY